MYFTSILSACAQNPPLPVNADEVVAPLVGPKADFSSVPGTVITHSPQSSKLFIGSPSIAILPDGSYVATHDEFGFGIEDRRAITQVFGSSDKGKSWQKLSTVNGAFWSSVFVHRGALYLLGTDKQYGRILIRRSSDGGKTWTQPTDEKTGVLRADGKFHCAPMPILEHQGRLWRAFEDANGPGGWGSHFRAFMMSAPVGADLLDAASWTSSNPIARDASWNGGDFGGFLEGNAVATPDGKVVDILRADTKSPQEKAAVVQISDDGKTATFDSATGFIDFPGGAKKFTIRFDAQSKLYWTLANFIPPRHLSQGPGGIRNTLALMASPDLRNWTPRTVLLYHPDTARHGFQYVDWQFEGNDIIYVARTAYDDGLDGARNNHDANFLTFHRAVQFRNLTMKDSVPMPEAVPVRSETRDFVISGSNFNLAKLANGERAFSNRDYRWQNLPLKFADGQFSRLGGGEKAQITLHMKTDAPVYIALAPSLPGVDLNGWTRATGTFSYTDTGKTEMQIYSRAAKKGETITIPQGNWTGSAVLLPAK